MSRLALQALDQVEFERRIGGLAELLHACVLGGGAVSFVQPFSVAEARAFWRDKVAPGVAAGSRILMAAIVEDRVAGSVQADLATPPNQPHRAEVAKLLVHPDFRRRGIARALMVELERRVAEAGRTLMTLDTRTGAEAEPLYLSLGYEIVGVIPDYALNPEGDGGLHGTTVMYKHLEVEEAEA